MDEHIKLLESMLHPDYLHPVSQMQPATGKILKAYRSLEPKEIIDIIKALKDLKSDQPKVVIEKRRWLGGGPG